MAGVGSNGGESKGRSVPLDDLSPSEELSRIKMTDGEITSASSIAYAVEQPGSASDVSQVLYVKDNVWVWPCRSSRIMGKMQLTLSRDIVYVSWLPYPGGKPQVARPISGAPSSSSASTSANGQANQTDPPATAAEASGYAIRPIPITDIEAFRKHTPSIGTHHVAIIMRDGSVHPPLHFFNGGIKAMIAVLKEHVNLMKSATDCNTYVVASTESAPQLPPSLDTHGSGDSPSGDPLGPPGGDNSSESPPVTGDLSDGGKGMLAARTSSGNGPPPLRASDFETSANSGSGPGTAAAVFSRPLEPSGATQSTGMNSNDQFLSLGRSLPGFTGLEALADRSVKGLARFLFPEHVETIAQRKEELSMNTAMADLYSKGPLGRARRLRVASACNGRQSTPPSSAASSNGKAPGKPPKAASTAVGSFELLSEDAAPVSSASLSTPLTPLAADEWATFMDARGRISDPAALWDRIYRGGVSTGLRKEVWKFLLGVYDIDSTAVERVERMRTLREQYRNVRWQWQAITDDQAAHWAKWRDRRNQVEKDVVRTDRDHPLFSAQDAPALGVMHRVLLSYVMYNQDLGYSQGMSDLLSVVLLVTTDETEAFWIFERLMHRVGGNFDRDQACCQAQLKGLARLVQLLDPPLHAAIRAAGATDYLFAFRWIMVLLKREFVLAEVPALWEALWTNTFSPQLHLYVALALLQYKRHDILSTGVELHSGHMHSLCGNLRGTVGLSEALQDAEALVMYAGAAGLTCLSEVPLPRLPVTGDILGEAGQAEAAPGALEELMGGPNADESADDSDDESDDESAESPSATQHTTSATPEDSVKEPLSCQELEGGPGPCCVL